MEDDHDVMIVSIRKNLLIVTHRLLFVAAKEIDLDTLHADEVHPTHVLLTLDGVRHDVNRALLNVVPPTAGAVPQEHINTLTLSIFHQLFHLLTTDVCVPPVVNEHILEAHRLRKLDVLHLVVVVDGIVLPDYPAPSSLSKFIMMGGIVTRLHIVPGDSRFHNRLQRGAHRDSTPRGHARQRKSRLDGTVAVVLLWHRELKRVEPVTLHVGKTRSAVTGIDTSLRDECPSVLVVLVSSLHVKEAGERISVSVLAALVHRFVVAITLLITGFRALPTNHGIRLRREERGCLAGEIKARRLLHDTDGKLLLVATTWMIGNSVTERHIVVADTKIDVIRIALRILQGHHQLVGLYVHLTEL